MADTDHWSSTPRIAAQTIVSELQARLLYVGGGVAGGGTGCVRSIKRIADLTPESVMTGIESGQPAILVNYAGGACTPTGIRQQKWNQVLEFVLLCYSEHFDDFDGRASGIGEMDHEAATRPGVEELQDFAARFGVRALRGVDGLAKSHILRIDPQQTIRPGAYIGIVELRSEREIDAYDDAYDNTLETLGVCRNPNDIAGDWFTDPPADLDPDSEWPDGLDGGKYPL